PDYGTMRLLELPRDQTAAGPGQVQNDFDTDAEAANELNILARGNSEVMQGNLLTLPVGGGLLYIQPVYVQAASGTQYPLLRRVLVSFGDTIGFAGTLDEALDQVFGGDSGVTTPDAGADPDGEATDDEDDQEADASDRLARALRDASDAMREADEALADSDWGAYGQAQERINQALKEAIEAEEEITGESIIEEELEDELDQDLDDAPADDDAGEE
ncbi:MAG TPA: UPF0182 family protein, partial [Beutenbergiaceae bacterium]|nr:UPF0182 family protein [Beutenbergiaceae bacterium]